MSSKHSTAPEPPTGITAAITRTTTGYSTGQSDSSRTSNVNESREAGENVHHESGTTTPSLQGGDLNSPARSIADDLGVDKIRGWDDVKEAVILVSP